MSGRPSRESIMNALFAVLTGSVQTSFTAGTQAGSETLTNPSTTAGLFIGLPVLGAGVPRGAIITGLSPLTISLPATVNAIGVPLTTGFLTFSRRFQFWDQVAAQPALFLSDGNEEMGYTNTVYQRQTLKCEIWIYSNAGQDQNVVPASALNYLLDAVQAALAPDNPGMGMFTLGGLVEWCRIEGEVKKDPGDSDGQAIARIPVEITVP